MPFINSDILIRNITFLMKSNNVTQEELANILGMSQPNVSKALSFKDKKCFTLDQVAGIAQYFGVSIDYLVGFKKSKPLETTPLAVAEFLSKIIESHDAKYKTIEIEELVFEFEDMQMNPLDGASAKKRNSSYLAIYLPNYWQLPKSAEVGEYLYDEALFEAQRYGNITRMKPVNDFLTKFIQIFEVFEKKGVDEDVYRTVVDNYLSKLTES